MNKEELEKLKWVVINMHISALLSLGVIWAPLVIAFNKIVPTLLVGYIALSFITIYNFIRHTLYLRNKPQYYKTKKRFIFEVVSFISCCAVAIFIGLLPILYQASGVATILIMIFKIIVGVYAFVSMSIMMASADRVNKICVKELKK